MDDMLCIYAMDDGYVYGRLVAFHLQAIDGNSSNALSWPVHLFWSMVNVSPLANTVEKATLWQWGVKIDGRIVCYRKNIGEKI